MIKNCARCGSLLCLEQVPVLGGSVISEMLHCIICGHVHVERIIYEDEGNKISLDSVISKEKRNLCSVTGCGDLSFCRGVCRSHYEQLHSFANCVDCGEHGAIVGRGLCSPCYARHTRRGTLHQFKPTGRARTAGAA